MEKLLNKLIERGWYPFCDNNVKEIRIYSDMDIECIYGKRKSDFYYTSYRKLASKESGLWQFCCKNKMVKEDDGHITRIINVYKDDDSIVDGGWDYHYWLMICSLLDEYELEDFLLSNIKVEGNEK